MNRFWIFAWVGALIAHTTNNAAACDKCGKYLVANYNGGGVEVVLTYGCGQQATYREAGKSVSVHTNDVEAGIDLVKQVDAGNQGRAATAIDILRRSAPVIVAGNPCPTQSCTTSRTSCYTQRATCYTHRPTTTSCCAYRGTPRCTCYTQRTSTCSSCNGSGCNHCRTSVGQYAHYGRCVAWRSVRTPLDCYRDPPPGREFWCNCPEHIAYCRRTYGYDCVWQLVPCGCRDGCSQCGGAGRCGQH